MQSCIHKTHPVRLIWKTMRSLSNWYFYPNIMLWITGKPLSLSGKHEILHKFLQCSTNRLLTFALRLFSRGKHLSLGTKARIHCSTPTLGTLLIHTTSTLWFHKETRILVFMFVFRFYKRVQLYLLLPYLPIAAIFVLFISILRYKYANWGSALIRMPIINVHKALI